MKGPLHIAPLQAIHIPAMSSGLWKVHVSPTLAPGTCNWLWLSYLQSHLCKKSFYNTLLSIDGPLVPMGLWLTGICGWWVTVTWTQCCIIPFAIRYAQMSLWQLKKITWERISFPWKQKGYSSHGNIPLNHLSMRTSQPSPLCPNACKVAAGVPAITPEFCLAKRNASCLS